LGKIIIRGTIHVDPRRGFRKTTSPTTFGDHLGKKEMILLDKGQDHLRGNDVNPCEHMPS